MALLDAFKDIVEHTHALGFIETVKLVGTPTDAKIETIDSDKTVVIYGEMYQPITGIESTIGLSRLAVLKGYMDSHTESTLTIVSEPRAGGADLPTEIEFNDKKGFVSNYRFISEAMISEHIKVPPFRGATWNITFEPTKKSIARLAQQQGILGGFEKRFTVSVDSKNTINFNIGSGPNDRTVVPFQEHVNGTLKHAWTYPLTQVLSILKLSGNVKLSFSDMGAMKIDIDSGLGKYTYILPAGKS